jgi:NADH dehydrogenase
MKREKIIIIGGGFGGLELAKKLNKTHFDVLLIDKQNHHQFQPLFYQVATSRLEPASISFPFRKIFQRSPNIQIRMAEVKNIYPDKNLISTSIGNFDYDHLVIATGCRSNFFGNEHIAGNALVMKNTQEAIQIRNKVLLNFEKIISAREEDKEALFNIVIVGAGPTGVELAGAFAEMRNDILPKDYPTEDFSKMKIFLIESSSHTLNNMSDGAKTASEKYLQNMGVIIKKETIVTDYDGLNITTNRGESIKSKNMIWAAGVTGNLIDGIPEEHIIRNRYIVNRQNKIKGYNNLYAIGDIAYMETPLYPKGHPQVANVAINQGKVLAKNLLNPNQKPVDYEYRDLGSMATIGKNRAVVDLPFAKIQGVFAWYIWMFLHLMLILGVRNKLIIFINWAWSYFNKDTSLRLIIKPEHDTDAD